MKSPEITFIVTYECPRCQTLLEVRGHDPSTWQRCPKCGRPSLPPEHSRVPLGERPSQDSGILMIGPEPDSPSQQTAAPTSIMGSHPGALRRIILAVGFLTSLTLLISAFFDQNGFNIVLFGIITFVIFGLLVLRKRRR